MNALDRARRLPLSEDDWAEAALNPQAYRVALRDLVEYATEAREVIRRSREYVSRGDMHGSALARVDAFLDGGAS